MQTGINSNAEMLFKHMDEWISSQNPILVFLILIDSCLDNHLFCYFEWFNKLLIIITANRIQLVENACNTLLQRYTLCSIKWPNIPLKQFWFLHYTLSWSTWFVCRLCVCVCYIRTKTKGVVPPTNNLWMYFNFIITK